MKGGTIQISWHDGKPVLTLDFHPLSGLLATAGADYDIKLWLINSGQAEKKVPSVSFQSSLTYHGCAVNTIRFSPSGELLASGADGGELIIWKLHPSETNQSWKVHKSLSQVALIKQSLFDQGYLDEQFMELEELQDDANPNFVEEVSALYFKDSARLINNIDQALERGSFDFNRLDSYMHQFKGSSTSIGASKVKAECTTFREYCRAGNAEGCLRTFQQLKKEHSTLRKKLEQYFQLARQAGPKETARRPK